MTQEERLDQLEKRWSAGDVSVKTEAAKIAFELGKTHFFKIPRGTSLDQMNNYTNIAKLAGSYFEKTLKYDENHPQAISTLAIMYEHDMLHDQNGRAFELYKKAAYILEDPIATLRLGLIYIGGELGDRSIKRDLDEGRRLIDKAIGFFGDDDLAPDIAYNALNVISVASANGPKLFANYQIERDPLRILYFGEKLLKNKEEVRTQLGYDVLSEIEGIVEVVINYVNSIVK